MLTKESARPLLRLYEALLCIYIIIAPINNALNGLGIYAMVGYSAMLLLAVGTPLGWLGDAFHADKRLGGIWTAVYMLIVFTVAATLTKLINYHGAAQVLMYTQFVSLSRRVNLKKIFIAFFISTIIGAIFSVSLGWVSSTVSRTATSVDGSIAPITLAIVLFAKEDFEKGQTYNVLKIAGLCCAVIVAFFGMSRSRLLFIAIMLLLKMIVSVRSSASSGKVSQTALLLIPVVLVVLAVVSNMDVTQQLMTEIERRYEGGFEDQIREMEAEAGWRMFKNAWLAGRGWNMLMYKMPVGYKVYNNHNMYVTILARGGIIMGLTLGISFLKVFKQVFAKKNIFAFVLWGLFLALGYGNAGIFNYTICSMIIPLAIILDQEEKKPEEEEQPQEEKNNEYNIYRQR